ncbi:CoA-binding protein [Pacificimonas sp. WHA3]|uniref:CoA-binding protein n=1 Tax=Pacificimonas pallii TaxID=2827236 RepID=A0ABS6SGS4_9SPHN|nr:CoA-binding protein [Pacificimonas pallii]MBV7257633.1 CoA-binding protein [Pacificimonas pallii]
MPLTRDSDIKALLESVRTIALVGLSNKASRDSNRVMKFLQGQGYRVIPVNPVIAGEEVHGETVVASLADVALPIDMVDVFRNSDAAAAVIDDAIAVEAGAVWMQLGVVNDEAAAKAEAAGMAVVMDRCPKIEIPRLGVQPR